MPNTPHTFIFPSTLNVSNSINFAQTMQDVPQSNEYLLDFSNVNFIEPFALIYIPSEINKLKEQHPESIFKVKINNTDSITYAAHMGFFHSFGTDFGKAPGEAMGSSTYIPITIINCQTLRNEAIETLNHVGDIIEKESSRLASILSRQDTGDLMDTLTYALREIIRNVVEHSESNEFRFCAQYWPTANKVEVSILDEGIGIRRSLSSNPNLILNSDKEALNYSLLPGISGKAYQNKKQLSTDYWANSGFGLYMLSQLGYNNGNFFIASGDTGLYLDKTRKESIAANLHGTAIRLVLKTDSLIQLSAMLESLRKEGYKIAKDLGINANLTASLASQMLRKNHNNK